MFDTVLGLPLHPLVVHAVVVLLPLSALGAVAVAVVPRWMRPYGPLVALGAVSAAGAALVARQSGQAFERRLRPTLGGPVAEKVAEHEQLGDRVVIASLPFAVLSVAALALSRRGTSPTAARLTAAAAALVGLAGLVLTVLAGHSGAEAVWNPGG